MPAKEPRALPGKTDAERATYQAYRNMRKLRKSASSALEVACMVARNRLPAEGWEIHPGRFGTALDLATWAETQWIMRPKHER